MSCHLMSLNNELWKESPVMLPVGVYKPKHGTSIYAWNSYFILFFLLSISLSIQTLCILGQAQEILTFWCGERQVNHKDRNMKAQNRLGHGLGWGGGGAPKSGCRWERVSWKTLSVHHLRSLRHPSKERIILIFLHEETGSNGLRKYLKIWPLPITSTASVLI